MRGVVETDADARVAVAADLEPCADRCLVSGRCLNDADVVGRPGRARLSREATDGRGQDARGQGVTQAAPQALPSSVSEISRPPTRPAATLYTQQARGTNINPASA